MLTAKVNDLPIVRIL